MLKNRKAAAAKFLGAKFFFFEKLRPWAKKYFEQAHHMGNFNYVIYFKVLLLEFQGAKKFNSKEFAPLTKKLFKTGNFVLENNYGRKHFSFTNIDPSKKVLFEQEKGI